MKYSVPSKLSSDCITTYFIDRELLDGFFFQQSKHFVSFLPSPTVSLVSQEFSSTSYEILMHILSQIPLREIFLLAQIINVKHREVRGGKDLSEPPITNLKQSSSSVCGTLQLEGADPLELLESEIMFKVSQKVSRIASL